MAVFRYALIFAILLVAQKAAPIKANPEEDLDYDYPDEDFYGEDYGEGMEDDGDVVVLTADNFADHVVGDSKYALVEFYAPWCGHCKELAPHYAVAATQLKEFDPTIVIGKVDATVHSELAQEFGVEGYPTLFWFKNGEPSAYGGGRTADAIVAWVKKAVGPPSTLVQTTEELNETTEDAEVSVLAFFTDLQGESFAAYQAMASSQDDVTFAHTTEAALAKEAGLTKEGIVLIKEFDGGNKLYDGELSEEGMSTFVKGNKLPIIIPFNEQNAEKIFGAGIDYQVLLFWSSDNMEDAAKIAEVAADQMRGQCLFVSVNTDEQMAADILEFFGLSAVDQVQVMGFSSKDEAGVKFKFNQEFTAEGLKTFAAAMVAGELEPDYKSEDIPAENNKPVTVVVGKSFNDIVKDETKDVLLEVYAPWCGHCKELEPIYKKLGKRFKDVESVVIAKLDGTANEHKELAPLVEGFPTLLFFPADAKDSPISVDAERTLKGLTGFIKKNAKIPFEIPTKKKEESSSEGLKEEL